MIQIHYFLGKNEEITLCWLWSFFCLLGMCLQSRPVHQAMLFINSVAAVWISGFLPFSSLDKQTRARMHRWWWWWRAGVGGRAVPWRKEIALLGLRGVSSDWVSHFQVGSMTAWQGSTSVLVPCATALMGMRSHTPGVGGCRLCGLGLKTAFIQQSV